MADSTRISSFDISPALSAGWDFFQANMGKLIPFGIVFFLASFVPSMILGAAFRDNESVGSIFRLVLQVWSIYLGFGATRFMLSLIRGKNPEISTLLNSNEGFVDYFMMNIRMIIVVVGGLLLLVVPGIYFALKYSFTMLLVADGKATGSEAFKMSAQMTEGRLLTLFMYAVVSALMFFVGAIFLVIPGFIAAAVSAIGMYFLYLYALEGVEKAQTPKIEG